VGQAILLKRRGRGARDTEPGPGTRARHRAKGTEDKEQGTRETMRRQRQWARDELTGSRADMEQGQETVHKKTGEWEPRAGRGNWTEQGTNSHGQGVTSG